MYIYIYIYIYIYLKFLPLNYCPVLAFSYKFCIIKAKEIYMKNLQKIYAYT